MEGFDGAGGLKLFLPAGGSVTRGHGFKIIGKRPREKVRIFFTLWVARIYNGPRKSAMEASSKEKVT